ncbi:MAG: tRNA (adenosine(37)-N6)-threonylcarbamoyltransferase complex dimerization subunit type 1 TsaB [Rhodospirillales bacterium]|nr:tRNA (adenosine(37)-N6)-threonylcarbamoyltransferase complex dimerization subunit type 1 TsaB [Rhodospirillales bacterium]
MIVLAFDTSTSACSAALWRDGTVLARRFAPMARGQSEALMPMIAEVMAEAGLGFGDLGLIGVTVGPGAFTGIRIALATARAIALAAGLPVAGITTTEAAAAAIPEAERAGRTLIAALDGKRADYFVQAFAADLTPLTGLKALLPQQVPGLVAGETVLAGDGAAALAAILPEAVVPAAAGPVDAAALAVRAALHYRRGTALPAQPLYLRPPDVTLPAP